MLTLFTQTYRIWWQKPKKIADVEDSREVSFLELFYDLAYVGIIYQITHALVAHLGVVELGQYIALYAMVWFAWVNGTLYHEMHGNNDLRTRGFTFLQVFALAFIAIFAPTAFGSGADGFAISYATFLAIVAFLWWRTGVHDSEHRPLTVPYTIGFLVTTTMFVGSIFVAQPVSFYMWIAGIVFALLLPIVIQRKNIDVTDEHREQAMKIRPSLVERFGLLTIIVLGEAIASVMRGASYNYVIDLDVVILVLLGLFISAAMWWSYFDLVARRLPIQRVGTRMAWIYLHLPVTLCIGLVASGLLYLLEHPESVSELDRWLIVGSVAVYLVCLAILIQTLQVRPENRIVYRKASGVAVIAAVLIILIGFLQLSILVTLVCVALLLVAPVYAAIRFWIARRHAELRAAAPEM